MPEEAARGPSRTSCSLLRGVLLTPSKTILVNGLSDTLQPSLTGESAGDYCPLGPGEEATACPAAAWVVLWGWRRP